MHASLKLIPTVDTQRTPALNEAAINQTQLIRFMRDRENLGLVQKLGGWTRFYPTAMPAVPRALWAWRDNLANDYLAIGCETSVSTPAVGAPLYVYDVDGGDDVDFLHRHELRQGPRDLAAAGRAREP